LPKTNSLNFYHRDRLNIVFFEFISDGKTFGQPVIFELFVKQCPKTVENFKKLCTGEEKKSDLGVTLHYLNSPIHRIVKDGWIQGGDIVDGRGTNGCSIYGKYFADESFVVKHEQPGIIAMSTSESNSNNSQYYITLRPLPSFDGKKVAFGRVISGLPTLYQLNELETKNQRPKVPVFISRCDQMILP